MEFFDKLGKKASEAYKMTADKTGKIAKETKNKLKITELKSQVGDLYKEIGQKVYENHRLEKEIDIKKDLEEQCTKIDLLSDEIDELLKECLNLKDKKQCPKCYTEMEKSVNYCPNCGEKQEEQETKEVEIIENDETKNNEESNENINQEESQNEKDNLEKTVEVESNVNIQEETEENIETENSEDEEEA